ncbi:hypothetical protein RB595_007947 [Gaeumannomyces hyphopodioides]
MSRQSTFSNTIHLRDFVDNITDDPSRENTPNYVEIQAEINVSEEDGFYSSRIDVEPIRTRIHAYLTQEERSLYIPNTFFYADGRFSAPLHPGEVSNFDEYRRYLPEKWCPMVTIIGFVSARSDNPPDPSEPRRFTLETSVYDTLKAAPVPFSVACSLQNTKRWEKVKIPPTGDLLSITAKVAGRTTDTNQLALRVLDLAYLPRPTSATSTPVTPASTVTPPSKRSARWEGRATPSTPSKKPRPSEPASEVANPPNEDPSSRNPTRSRLGLPHVQDVTESSLSPPSPSTAADPAESFLTSVPFPDLDGDSRPHRNRHPPKRLQT